MFEMCCLFEQHWSCDIVCTHSTPDSNYQVIQQNTVNCVVILLTAVCYFGCLHSCLMKTLHHLRKVNVFVLYIWPAMNLSCITFPLFCIWFLYMTQLVLELLLRTLVRFFCCFLCVNTLFVFNWIRFTGVLWPSSKRLLCSCSDCPSINICVVLANMLVQAETVFFLCLGTR
jgi:hypothetical protein